jgi:hypothetical protein
MLNSDRMKTGSIFTFSFILFLLVSCERDADIKLPPVPARIAVNCYISPGDSVIAWVSEVKSLFDRDAGFNARFIENAAVMISNGNDSVFLQLDQVTREFYHKSGPGFMIEKGRTYFLRAEAPGFPPVSASCTVPTEKVADFQYAYTAVPEGTDTLISIFFSWKDIPGQKNYYRIAASLIDSFSFFPNQYLFDFSQNMHADEGNDGGLLSSGKGQMFLSNGNVSSRHIKSTLITCEEHYYRYHLSLHNYSGNNPFVEPSQLYTNMQGGLGVFGAYLQETKHERIF